VNPFEFSHDMAAFVTSPRKSGARELTTAAARSMVDN
jgi:hypothetical protein